MADAHSTIKHNDHLLLDQPLLRLPTELLRKNLHTSHYAIEKQTTTLKTAVKDAATNAVSGRASKDDILRSLDASIARARGLQQKLAACAEEESHLHDKLDARIDHLDELYGMNTVEDVKYETWSRRRLYRLVIDYLLRLGYNETAAGLAEELQMAALVDVDTFIHMSRIREALLQGNVSEALGWCEENKKQLRKNESKLIFMLRLQQYIELVRAETPAKLQEAFAHCRQHLGPYRTQYKAEVDRACALVAFPPRSHAVAPAVYRDMYSPQRWIDLADAFTAAHNELLALPRVPLLHIALSSGLSALKTPACHTITSHRHILPPISDSVCPICSNELHELARNVPYAHHTQSHVDNDLVLLPNSFRVISRHRLEVEGRQAGLPPDTGRDEYDESEFSLSSLKRVYIT